ncbi:hypothetical protein [Gilliamella apicola]|uniref:Uncharacterized protein n=1 Tax=Gilliamella apicola TaxID=1196095 RepID=A0A2V4DVD1_9GAMM|nr:hypothetical protein [Gilliamella apicola]PXZ04755.1 hypothetical protein DKK79_10460 [Gilliamella apicola]
MTQGGGNTLQNKESVTGNIVESQKGKNDGFTQHASKESQLADNWNNTNQAHNVNNYEKYKDKTISQMEKHMSPEHLHMNVQAILIYQEAHNKLTMLVQLDLAGVMEPEVY